MHKQIAGVGVYVTSCRPSTHFDSTRSWVFCYERSGCVCACCLVLFLWRMATTRRTDVHCGGRGKKKRQTAVCDETIRTSVPNAPIMPVLLRTSSHDDLSDEPRSFRRPVLFCVLDTRTDTPDSDLEGRSWFFVALSHNSIVLCCSSIITNDVRILAAIASSSPCILFVGRC